MTESLYFNQRHSPVATLSLLLALLIILHLFTLWTPGQLVWIACCPYKVWMLVCALPWSVCLSATVVC